MQTPFFFFETADNEQVLYKQSLKLGVLTSFLLLSMIIVYTV